MTERFLALVEETGYMSAVVIPAIEQDIKARRALHYLHAVKRERSFLGIETAEFMLNAATERYNELLNELQSPSSQDAV